AERKNIHTLERLLESVRVTPKHFMVRGTIMTPANRLCAPQVRLGGDDDVRILSANFYQRELQCFEVGENEANCLPHEQSKIRCDLIVAATAGMQFACCRSNF